MKYWLLMGTIVAGLAACGDAEEADTDTTDSTPTESADTTEATDVSTGEKVANSSCIGCHGVDLTGGMGPNLTTISLSKEGIIDVLIKGRGSMPPGTANGEEEAVADYLLSLR